MLTPLQTQACKHIFNTVPELPEAIVNLIGGYVPYEEMVELAQRPVTIHVESSRKHPWGTDYLDAEFSIRNSEAVAAIKFCLSSSDIAPEVKSIILKKLVAKHIKPIQATKIEYGKFDLFKYERLVNVRPGNQMLAIIFNDMRKDGMRINLDHAQLEQLDFSGLDLRGMTAVGAVFNGSLFKSSRLEYSDISLAHFKCAELNGSRLDHVKAIGANFHSADLSEVCMESADFSSANLCNSKITKSNLTNADLRNANLGDVNFSNSRLRFVDFRNAQFWETFLSTSDSDLTDMTGVVTLDESMAKFLTRFKKYFTPEISVSGKVFLSSIRKGESIDPRETFKVNLTGRQHRIIDYAADPDE